MTDDLMNIPGVGPSIAQDLRDLGYGCVDQLRDEDPDPGLLKWWAWKDQARINEGSS